MSGGKRIRVSMRLQRATYFEALEQDNHLYVIPLLLLAWALLLHRLDTIPPGFQHDETFNVYDVIDVLHGRFRLYFPANFGREPLFFYATALIYRLSGLHFVWGLRFTGVVWAIVAVPLFWVLSRRLGFSRARAGIATFLVITSFWFIFTSRVGLRAVTLLPVSIAVFYFIARALLNQDAWSFPVAGVLSGISVYTYPAGRLLFGFFSAFMVAMMAISYTRRKNGMFKLWGASIIVAWTVAIPMVVFIVQDPDVANRRVYELSAPLRSLAHGDVHLVLRSSVATFVTILWRNEDAIPYHYSIPDMSILIVPLGILFVTGVVCALWSVRHVRSQVMLLGLMIGLMPDMLSEGGPIFLRGIIGLPFVFLLVLQGLACMESGWRRICKRTWGNMCIAFFMIGGMLWHSTVNIRGYFWRWATAPATFEIYRGDLRGAASYVDSYEGKEPVYLSTSFWLDLDQQTFLLYQPVHPERVRWFNARLGIPLPSPQGALYVFTRSSPPRGPVTCALTGFDWKEIQRIAVAGAPLFNVVHVPNRSTSCVLTPLSPPLEFGNILRLIAFSFVKGRGQDVVLTHWIVQRPWPRTDPPKISVRIRDSRHKLLAQHDDLMALAYQQWRAGDEWIQMTVFREISDIDMATGEQLGIVVYDASGALPAHVGEDYLGEEGHIRIVQDR